MENQETATPNNQNQNAASSGDDQSRTGRALYHCNYCEKDITGKVRVKCAVCPDFDLCVECFSVGAEITPHKSSHSYQVMRDMSFPLTCLDWTVDEELLLLEALGMFGICNWEEVEEHVATKSKEECLGHYNDLYLNSPDFLPDMSFAVGKNLDKLLELPRKHQEEKKGLAAVGLGKVSFEEESPVCPSKDKAEELQKTALSGCQLPKAERSSKGKEPNYAGFHADVENQVAEMEFSDSDTPEEREIKLRVLKIYNKGSDQEINRRKEIKRLKEIVKEIDLLYSSPFMKSLSPEEMELCRPYKPFLRFLSKEERKECLEVIVEEYRTAKRIQFLTLARTAGCRTSGEAMEFLEPKRREAEAKKQGAAEKTGHAAGAGSSNQGDTQAAQLLSEAEKRLCLETQLTPRQYLVMQEVMTRRIFRGEIAGKSDAHQLFGNIDPGVVDRVYDMLVKKGIAQD